MLNMCKKFKISEKCKANLETNCNKPIEKIVCDRNTVSTISLLVVKSYEQKAFNDMSLSELVNLYHYR